MGSIEGSFRTWLIEAEGISLRLERGFSVDNSKATIIKLAVAACVGALYKVLRHYEISQMISLLCCVAVIVALYFWSRRSVDGDLDSQDEIV